VVIRTENLTKLYGPVVGIEGLNLEVEEGEIFGFLGPNGAGKTTTIRLLLDLTRPTKGRAFLFGQNILHNSLEAKERLGYLPGEFRAFPSMTGIHMLDFLASFRAKQPVLREELAERLEFSPQVLRKRIKTLSHGNRQKLGIILALEHEPDLSILDEPTLGLDPLMQEAFYDILRLFRDRRKTILLSSHVLSEVEKVCDRVGIIRNGRLVALESIEALRAKQVRRLVVILDMPSEPPLLPGAQLLTHREKRFEYLVKGDVQAVVRALADLPLQDVVFPEPNLEDVFMVYYQDSPS